MTTISVPEIFPTITKANIKETYSLYNQFVKNAMNYQLAIINTANALSDLSHSYDNFLSYEPMRVIIESENKQYDIHDSLEIHKILYDSYVKMGDYLNKNFSHLLKEFEIMQDKVCYLYIL